MSRRRVLVRSRAEAKAEAAQPLTAEALLEQLKAQSAALIARISQISAAQSAIVDTRLTGFETDNSWRCRWCREEQHPKGLSNHERWCDHNPDRGTYTKR